MDGFREAFLGLRVSPQTVTSVRTNLETDAQFEHLQSRVTADGKTRVIRKPSPTPTPALSPPPITKEAPPAAPITVEEIEAVEAVSPECPTPVGTSRGNARGHALAVAPAAHRVLGARRRTGARRSSRRPRLADRRGQSVARFDHAEIDRSSAFRAFERSRRRDLLRVLLDDQRVSVFETSRRREVLSFTHRPNLTRPILGGLPHIGSSPLFDMRDPPGPTPTGSPAKGTHYRLQTSVCGYIYTALNTELS